MILAIGNYLAYHPLPVTFQLTIRPCWVFRGHGSVFQVTFGGVIEALAAKLGLPSAHLSEAAWGVVLGGRGAKLINHQRVYSWPSYLRSTTCCILLWSFTVVHA